MYQYRGLPDGMQWDTVSLSPPRVQERNGLIPRPGGRGWTALFGIGEAGARTKTRDIFHRYNMSANNLTNVATRLTQFLEGA